MFHYVSNPVQIYIYNVPKTVRIYLPISSNVTSVHVT